MKKILIKYAVRTQHKTSLNIVINPNTNESIEQPNKNVTAIEIKQIKPWDQYPQIDYQTC